MFQIVAVPFDAFQQLPEAQDRWLAMCLARYVNKLGQACPSLRQLAADSRMSLAAVSRRLAAMGRLGVFQREREPGRRYHYQLAESFRPRWPGRGVPPAERGVPHAGKQEVEPSKYANGRARSRARWFAKNQEGGLPDRNDSGLWMARLRTWKGTGGRLWPIDAGPRPDEAGCWAPKALLLELRQ